MTIRRAAVLVAVCVILTTMTSTPSVVSASEGRECLHVDNRLVFRLVPPPECTSPFGLCAQANVVGQRLRYFYVVDEAAPMAGLFSAPADLLSTIGDAEFRSGRRTFTGTKIGVFHTATGETTATYLINDVEEGVTGSLVAAGFSSPTGRGRGWIRGRICMADED